MYVWVMSQSYTATTGEPMPVAYNYGKNHHASGYEANGWGLVWLSLASQQLEFLKSGVDDRVEVVGKEHSKVTPLLLQTYADKLGDLSQYGTLQDVLDKLSETEPRFLADLDERKP